MPVSNLLNYLDIALVDPFNYIWPNHGNVWVWIGMHPWCMYWLPFVPYLWAPTTESKLVLGLVGFWVVLMVLRLGFRSNKAICDTAVSPFDQNQIYANTGGTILDELVHYTLLCSSRTTSYWYQNDSRPGSISRTIFVDLFAPIIEEIDCRLIPYLVCHHVITPIFGADIAINMFLFNGVIGFALIHNYCVWTGPNHWTFDDHICVFLSAGIGGLIETVLFWNGAVEVNLGYAFCVASIVHIMWNYTNYYESYLNAHLALVIMTKDMPVETLRLSYTHYFNTQFSGIYSTSLAAARTFLWTRYPSYYVQTNE